jgi:myo-inositol-1(or 4)-monophosphatase
VADAPAPGLSAIDTLAGDLAQRIREAIFPHLGTAAARTDVGRAPGGDTTMAIDEIAEQIVEQTLSRAGDVAYYSEDRGFVVYGDPRAILVIDPVDGTRPAAAGFEACCVSIAVVPPDEHATLGDVSFGVVKELKTGTAFSAHRGGGVTITALDGTTTLPALSTNTDLRSLFWTAGQRGRPLLPTSVALEELVDGSSMQGGYFDLGSAAFAITRVVTGQLDAYVDLGRRIVDELPATEAAFVRVGQGAVCTNFPYDVAAAALVLEEAGGVITMADGSPIGSHPAVGSSRAEGLAVLAAASPQLHASLRDAVDRGLTRLADRLTQAPALVVGGADAQSGVRPPE